MPFPLQLVQLSSEQKNTSKVPHRPHQVFLSDCIIPWLHGDVDAMWHGVSGVSNHLFFTTGGKTQQPGCLNSEAELRKKGGNLIIIIEVYLQVTGSFSWKFELVILFPNSWQPATPLNRHLCQVAQQLPVFSSNSGGCLIDKSSPLYQPSVWSDRWNPRAGCCTTLGIPSAALLPFHAALRRGGFSDDEC